MTRYAVDAPTLLRILRDPAAVDPSHRLVGTAALRSQVLAALVDEVRGGRLDEGAARRLLEVLAGVRIRLLGDRVSRATAWRIALRDGIEDVAVAEVLSVATLQADALVAGDPAMVRAAEGLVPLAPFEALLRA